MLLHRCYIYHLRCCFDLRNTKYERLPLPHLGWVVHLMLVYSRLVHLANTWYLQVSFKH